MHRDQSEDRIRGPLYLTVGYEHPKWGLVYYVQAPNGERSSIYTRDAGVANAWATSQAAEHPNPPGFVTNELWEEIEAQAKEDGLFDREYAFEEEFSGFPD